jgi:hypothetical protein
MIVAAAIRFPAKPDPTKPTMADLILHVPAPGRHHNVLHSLFHQFADGKTDRKHESYAGEVQGFLTNRGEFLNRREAFAHVKACGQTMLRKMGEGYQGDELFSEDLW